MTDITRASPAPGRAKVHHLFMETGHPPSAGGRLMTRLRLLWQAVRNLFVDRNDFLVLGDVEMSIAPHGLRVDYRISLPGVDPAGQPPGQPAPRTFDRHVVIDFTTGKALYHEQEVEPRLDLLQGEPEHG